MTIFVHMGQAADGTFPKAGTAVRYRCAFCSKICDGIQPEPGRVLIACGSCPVEEWRRETEVESETQG